MPPKKQARTYNNLQAFGSMSRVEQIAKLHNVTLRELEQLCSIPTGTFAALKFRQKANPNIDISFDTAQKILAAYQSINARWLLTGEGKVFEQGAVNITDMDRAMFVALKERIRRLDVFVQEINETTDLMTQI